MSDPTPTSTTVSNIGVAMFSVADQDAALDFYTSKLGFEVRSDQRFGENDAMRWLEVAPPGSTARLALNPPMSGQPGGGSIGVETTDVLGEHERLKAIGGVDVDEEPMRAPDVPLMFGLRDPDGNSIWVVEAPAAR
jgi:catechol 2,3-dioxygenase-like lactoylglutathione lyase family enzyme